ncbi:MAG: SDR family NAD(P)-dependent oxidoreductase [Candidatus Methylacidiphilales bacterium]|nr:SDR family oxidoreductase [Candidatus Methylacidiphilales bacterium]
MSSLVNKRVIITGASQGLGKQIALHFMAEGASVSICSRSEGDLEDALQELRSSQLTGLGAAAAPIFGSTCDVSKADDVARFIREATEALGGVDVLINNAGIVGPIGRIEEVDYADWIKTLEINLLGVVHTCRQVIPLLKQNSATQGARGKIINISGGGATNPMPRCSSYAASKAAVVRITETMAEELREFGIDVNAVAPGAMRTRMMQQVLEAGPEKAGEDYYKRNVKWMEEGATPPDLGAKLCAFLASDQSNGITGKLISAQWDPWTTLSEHVEDLRSDIYTLRRIVPEDRGKSFGS